MMKSRKERALIKIKANLKAKYPDAGEVKINDMALNIFNNNRGIRQ